MIHVKICVCQARVHAVPGLSGRLSTQSRLAVSLAMSSAESGEHGPAVNQATQLCAGLRSDPASVMVRDARARFHPERHIFDLDHRNN